MSDFNFIPHTPSRKLRQLAIQRCLFFQRELKEKYGIEVRSGIELEFFTVDGKGKPVAHGLDYTTAAGELEAMPLFEDMIQEASWPGPAKDSRFEIKVGESKLDGHPRYRHSPLAIAGITEHFKKHELAKQAGKSYTDVSFDPHPTGDENTASTQVNLSLCDEQGHPLFARDISDGKEVLEGDESPISFLAKQCIHSMIRMQKQAAITMLPTQRSLDRLRKTPPDRNTVPRFLGFDYVKHTEKSVALRLEMPGFAEQDPRSFRLENRLPGTDADPYVVMAMSMAALYDAVKRHVFFEKPDPEKHGHDEFQEMTINGRTAYVRKCSEHYHTELMPSRPEDIYPALCNNDWLRGLLDDPKPTGDQPYLSRLAKENSFYDLLVEEFNPKRSLTAASGRVV